MQENDAKVHKNLNKMAKLCPFESKILQFYVNINESP